MTGNFFHVSTLKFSGNQQFLERPRIDDLLERAMEYPILTVVAGAGYGKSQAVYSFARRYNVRTTWLQFSEGDNVRDRFWEKFVETVSVISRESAAKLAEIGFPATERQFSRYVGVPRTDIIAAEKYIFVYDDIHLIHDKPVLDFLERSITAPFPNITSIIISRTEPPLNLASFESNGMVARIDEEHLRFNRDETAEYFRLLGLRPSIQVLAGIYRDTEGWAFAIHLAGLALKNSKGGESYVSQAMRSNIFLLLESEIFSGLSAPLKKFLIKLSLIEYPVPDLLREIASGEDYSLIDEMEQTGSFIRFDTYLNAYRIHHLFLDFLRGRQNEISGTEKREVWYKAAGWCVRNNHKMDAILYYEKAGDYDSLLSVIYTLTLVISKNTASILLRIMENAPKELYDKNPTAWIVRSRLLLNLEQFDRVKAELIPVVTVLESELPPVPSGSGVPRQIDPARARTLSGCYDNLGFAVYLGCTYTRDYSFVNYFEKAHYYSALIGFKVPPPNSIMNLESYVCRVTATESGEMERHNRAVAEMVLHLAAAMNGCGWGMDDIAWGELAFFKGDMARAEECFNRALVKAREKDQYEIENRALFYLLRINMSSANTAAIEELLCRLKAQLDQTWYINRFIYYDIVTGWFYIQTNRAEKTAAWLKNDFEESDLNSLVHGMEILVKTKYQFAQKRYPAAIAGIGSRRQEKTGAFSSVLGKLETKVMEAVCRYRLEDNEGAYRDLESAWELAQSNGLYMPFTELGKDMRALAGAALKEPAIKIPRPELEKIQRSAVLYAKNAFAVAEYFQRNAPGPEKKKHPGAGLSRRELDVLGGLAQGLTREEIARVSSISVNTVKSAMRSVYNKLGAVNRSDAVRIATEQEIL